MSAGHVHTRASLILATGYFLGACFITQDPKDLEYVVGALIGVMVTPDCDVDAGFIADRYIRKRFGKWIEKLWDGLWYMYRRSLKHGGELSHFPVIGTSGRITYLYMTMLVIPYIGMYLIWQFDIWHELTWWNNLLIDHYRVILGLMHADLIHWALDIATTEHKPKRSTNETNRRIPVRHPASYAG